MRLWGMWGCSWPFWGAVGPSGAPPGAAPSAVRCEALSTVRPTGVLWSAPFYLGCDVNIRKASKYFSANVRLRRFLARFPDGFGAVGAPWRGHPSTEGLVGAQPSSGAAPCLLRNPLGCFGGDCPQLEDIWRGRMLRRKLGASTVAPGWGLAVSRRSCRAFCNVRKKKINISIFLGSILGLKPGRGLILSGCYPAANGMFFFSGDI